MSSLLLPAGIGLLIFAFGRSLYRKSGDRISALIAWLLCSFGVLIAPLDGETRSTVHMLLAAAIYGALAVGVVVAPRWLSNRQAPNRVVEE